MEISTDILNRLQALEEKYAVMGQDWISYLDGLLVANYLTYWDYIHLDTLLSLQNPRTDFPDEQIFIVYHQHTEIFFKLILSEMYQLSDNQNLTPDYFLNKINRMNRYFGVLVDSFEVMTEGMDKEQFLQFRMALLPASGFQSVQYRMIEICTTKMRNLLVFDERYKIGSEVTMNEMYEFLYWRQGATELATQKQTLTLQQFEKKYRKTLIELATAFEFKNLWMLHRRLTLQYGENQEITNALRTFDGMLNINWALAHYRSAVRYLQRNPETIAATGGTNWQQYLPPRFQKRISFPELWSEEEIENWGKSWVESQFSIKK
ncbi:MAG: tryptophan 2,3-dioxygenase [Verrucomicrobia bacterium]|nr:tryptophan 2,3-dioxygenase [Cytophagales bacterium]